MMLARNKIIGSILLSLLTLGLINACTYTTPETENPNPGLESLSTMCVQQDGNVSCRKSFFGIKVNEEANNFTRERKKWMCGWAPVAMGGVIKGGLTAAPYQSRHCNIEFRITKNGKFLEAREVNVDYPNDLDRWQQLIVIPIVRHYYYEKQRDSRGRELNRFAKVDRNNWKVAPYMDLDVSKIRFVNRGKSPYYWPNEQVTDIYDVESTVEEGDRNFFGFTGTLVDGLWFGSDVQHEVRFNFYEFKENPNFQPTKYDQNNSKYMNILHILGSKPNAWSQIKLAAHWDVKTKPVEFCLNGFPENDPHNLKQIGYDVIKEMNDGMRRAKVLPEGKDAFVVSDKKLKYPFDLRCPSITWVDDPYLSMSAPLGIGLVNTNIRTGEILWGNAIVWGGLINYIVNRDHQYNSDALTVGLDSYWEGRTSGKYDPHYEDLANHLSLDSIAKERSNFETLGGRLEGAPNYNVLDAYKNVAGRKDEIIKDYAEIFTDHYTDHKDPDESKRDVIKFLTDIEKYVKTGDFQNYVANPGSLHQSPFIHGARKEIKEFTSNHANEDDYLHSIDRRTKMSVSFDLSDQEKENKNTILANLPAHDKLGPITFQYYKDRVFPGFDYDNQIRDHYFEWMKYTDPNEKGAAARSVIKNVMLHELGHVVGMGHQFEGNRMPEEGTVPHAEYKKLKEASHKMENYTSIMDYMHGRTEVNLHYDDVQIKQQDELVLQYLYNQKYAAYKPGMAKDEFVFFDIPSDGAIPPETPYQGGKIQTQYYPQCNDIEAWLAVSPYCRRWDRGYDAPTIVEQNYKSFSDSFLKRMNSFTGATGLSPWSANYRLWRSTYRLMNYNRTFYDHMRYTLHTNPTYKKVFKTFVDDDSFRGLIEYSKACINPAVATEELQIEFAKLALKPTIMTVKDPRLEKQQAAANYSDLLSKYKSIVGSRDVIAMNDEQYLELEDELKTQGVALSEFNKLCRATKKSLAYTRTLLSLKGGDFADVNHKDTIVPTGIHGGNASPDYSKIWGTTDQVGLLPLKLAALDVFTATASTMRYGWWRIGKPRFNDHNIGKYGYFSLYPEEFTDVIGVAVKNNMGFGDSSLRDNASLSVANLYIPYFLYRTFYLSNDKQQPRGFDDHYLRKIRAQTSFDANISAVLLTPIKVDGELDNRRFGFKPKIYVFGTQNFYDLPEAYALKHRTLIVRPTKNQIIFPISKIRFINRDNAYAWAIEVTYDKADFDDEFQGFSIKNTITDSTDGELFKCIDRNGKGLQNYFVHGKFQGFLVGEDIATVEDTLINFEKSLRDEFTAYKDKFNLTGNICSEQERGIGLITSTALSLDGFIMKEVFDFIQQ